MTDTETQTTDTPNAGLPNAAVTELLVQHLADAEFAKTGRRSFFTYRDTGLTDASDGAYRAQVIKATDVMETTGWHYHVCDMQFVYILKGWIDLAFEGDRVERVAEGGVLAIPPGMVHNELAVSPDFEALEVVAPATMETIAVDGPPE